jgi:hypothetical protein
LEIAMPSIRRKGRRRARRAARKTGPRRMLVRLTLRVARPFAPGMIAGAAGSYFLNKSSGGDRRKKALGAVGAVAGRAKGRKAG